MSDLLSLSCPTYARIADAYVGGGDLSYADQTSINTAAHEIEIAMGTAASDQSDEGMADLVRGSIEMERAHRFSPAAVPMRFNFTPGVERILDPNTVARSVHARRHIDGGTGDGVGSLFEIDHNGHRVLLQRQDEISWMMYLPDEQ